MLAKIFLLTALSATALALSVPQRRNIGDGDCVGGGVPKQPFLDAQSAVQQMGDVDCPIGDGGRVGPCVSGVGIHVYDVADGAPTPRCVDVSRAAAILVQDCGAYVQYFGDQVNGHVGVNSQYTVGVLTC